MDELLQYQDARGKWSPRLVLRRVHVRVRRMIKRRLRGESQRQWIERNLNDSEAGLCFDMVQIFVSLVMVMSIIAQNWSGTNFVRAESYRIIDVTNLVAITINFGLRYFAASDRRLFCFQWLSIFDGFCWIALLVEMIVPNDDSKQSKYEYRFFLLMRTSRLFQVFRLRRLAKSAKARQAMLIGLTGLCILICAAAAFQTIEYCDTTKPQYVNGVNCQDLSFFESVYFVCITIGTVGFGEYAPKSKMGKLADIFLIIFTGVLIPTQISGLTDILSRETAFDKKYLPDKRVQHVLLCGDIENASLDFFLHSWLHGEGDRGNRRKVIILSPKLPSSSVRRVLLRREYEQRVLYLQGSAMDTNDLQRAGAPTAAYCFVMAKKHSTSQDEDDTATNLVTCSIRKNNRHAPLYVQVSKLDNVRHVNISGASAVICIEQLRLSLLAKSLWIRGLNAFLGNLSQRFTIADEKGGFWMKDYMGGATQCVHEATVPSFLFAMVTFRSLAILIYREFSVSVIGIRTLQDTVVVYPVNKDLNDIAFHSVFVLSSTRDTVARIEKMTAAVFTRHPDISPSVGMESTKSNRTITGVISALSAGIPFQRLSSVLADVNGESHISTMSRHGNDKISPLGLDDETGDSDNSLPSSQRTKRGMTVVKWPRPVHHPSSIRSETEGFGGENTYTLPAERDPSESSYVPPLVPVVALTPAQLLKKATAPLSPRDTVGKPLTTPRSARLPSPRKSEAAAGLKPSSNETGTPRPSTGPSSTKLTTYADRKGPADQSALVSAAQGPTIATIRESCAIPPKIIQPPEALGSADEGSERLESVHLSSPWVRGGPTSLRRATTKRDSQRVIRSSKYRSFRRRSPPSDLAGHYVVCGLPSNYSSLLSNLSDLDEEQTPVVFVTPAELSEKDFGTYVEFKNVFFVRGSPVSMETFDEARMLHAKSILINSYCGQAARDARHSDTEQFDENMADVDAITTHRFISEACQNRTQAATTGSRIASTKTQHRISSQPPPSMPYIVVEMMRPSNVKFLVDRSGSLYDANSEVNELRARDLLRDAHALDDAFFSPLYAGGNIYFSNFMDALLGSTSQNSFLIDMITQLVISGNYGLHQLDRDARSRHRLSQIPAPARYHNRPFALLVEGLLFNEDAIALGIYRAGHGFVAPAYVITNPAANELIKAHDLIFVIK